MKAIARALLALLLLAAVAGAKPRPKVKVLISMIDAQEAFFKQEVIPGFAKKEKADVEVVHFGSVDSIASLLRANAGSVVLVKVPFDKSWSLVEQDLIKPLNSFLSNEQMSEFNNTFLLTSLARQGDKQYYVPRKFETRVMVYLKSRVAEAVAVWRKYREDINTDLKKYNGLGLPATYILKEDPNQWDFYDLFVAGWVWAHTPYDGKTAPRIAHRGQRYSGTALGLIDQAFQCGADSAMVLCLKGDPVVDAFHWEAVLAAAGIYNPRMWTEKWAGAGIWQGFKEGQVFLSFMTQIDCFFIHGTGRDGLTGNLQNPDDFGVAVMPTGCSVELDKVGDCAREGCKSITTGGWWWGIPASSPDPQLSYRLARYITSTENQIQESTRFGMIPVRKDILGDMTMLFGGGWITDVYNASFRQLMENKKTCLPNHPHIDKIQDVYLDAWFDIVVGKDWSKDGAAPDRSYIAQVLAEKYAPRAALLR